MSQILTFLGKGGTGRTTIAVAAAKTAALQGKRVLLVGHGSAPSLALRLGVSVTTDPQSIGANLSVVQLKATVLLEQSWGQARELEAQYVRTPFFKEIYAQELAILPGMDQVLALDALRGYDASGLYDTIIYDGSGDISTLRMFGMPEVASWYWRRAAQAFRQSDLAKTLGPFVDPLLRSVSTVNVSLEDLPKRLSGSDNFLEAGRQAVSDPRRVLAYLVTTADPVAVHTAKYLWGSAQMVGLTVGGVILTPTGGLAELSNSGDFSPLKIYPQPHFSGSDWQVLESTIAPILVQPQVPLAVTIDEGNRTVRLFIPGFEKSQIELSQSGPELTITAGDQRRNLFLPASLAGRQVIGAKFLDAYLVISFG